MIAIIIDMELAAARSNIRPYESVRVPPHLAFTKGRLSSIYKRSSIMPNNDFHEDHEPNAIERDRMERREQTKRKSRISSILVIVIGVAVIIGMIIAIASLVGKNKKSGDTEPSTVTATIVSVSQETQGSTEATAPKSTQPARDPALNNIASSQDNNAQQSTLPSSASSSASSDVSSDASSSSAASAGGSYSSGNSLHYTASGQTSYGYDWTYSGGGGIVNVGCNYDFNTKQYDFNITGVAPGTTALTLYYNTADGVQQPVNMTVQVDSNLNVTQIG